MKQSIVVRTDLNMSKGKLSAQVAHASLKAYKKAPDEIKKKWERAGSRKIILKVDSKNELSELKKIADNRGVPAALIVDEGRTELKKGTFTALAVGPSSEEKVDSVTGDLKVL